MRPIYEKYFSSKINLFYYLLYETVFRPNRHELQGWDSFCNSTFVQRNCSRTWTHQILILLPRPTQINQSKSFKILARCSNNFARYKFWKQSKNKFKSSDNLCNDILGSIKTGFILCSNSIDCYTYRPFHAFKSYLSPNFIFYSFRYWTLRTFRDLLKFLTVQILASTFIEIVY